MWIVLQNSEVCLEIALSDQIRPWEHHDSNKSGKLQHLADDHKDIEEDDHSLEHKMASFEFIDETDVDEDL